MCKRKIEKEEKGILYKLMKLKEYIFIFLTPFFPLSSVFQRITKAQLGRGL
jgi:hypothetical protein